MKQLCVGGVAVVLVGLIAALSAAQKPEEAAESSAREWLALVDSGKYAESWKEAAQFSSLRL